MFSVEVEESWVGAERSRRWRTPLADGPQTVWVRGGRLVEAAPNLPLYELTV